MSRIRSTKTRPEEIVAAYLRENHIGYRRYLKSLPGHPDFVLTKYKAVIFVNGCFWHRHEGCKRATTPKTNQDYWEAKFRRTVERDKAEYAALERDGWRVFVVWECELGAEASFRLKELIKEIVMEEYYFE